MDRLERVQFYAGQRLLAADLNDQESYEIRLRRMLNKGLFSSGVVTGLEVAQVENSTKKLTVKSGLALDPLGREVYLASNEDVTVPNQPPLAAPGYYLIIRYRETSVTGRPVDCLPSAALPPARYRIEPIIKFTDLYPDAKKCTADTDDLNCGVVLALVRLNDSCEIASIETGIRQFSYPTHMSQVTAMALEGEKDINATNPKKLRFHIHGGAPNAVLLYLRGAEFSSLYYTELGNHIHSLTRGSGQTQPKTVEISHSHALQPFNTDGPSTLHSHDVLVDGLTPGVGIPTGSGLGYALWMSNDPATPARSGYRGARDVPVGGGARLDFAAQSGSHSHSVPGRSTEGASPNSSATHVHDVDGFTTNTDAAGSSTLARGGTPLGFLNNVKVELDSKDITNKILALLDLTSLGQGGAGDPINNADGTGAIDLLRLPGVSLEMGPHELVFSVADGGGKLLYNLYIE
jgi:hypothetical protein